MATLAIAGILTNGSSNVGFAAEDDEATGEPAVTVEQDSRSDDENADHGGAQKGGKATLGA
ncbi:MAG: hypothetical protein AAF989_10815, partial [Planctomycetota bacterium]